MLLCLSVHAQDDSVQRPTF